MTIPAAAGISTRSKSWRGVPQMPSLEGFEDGWGDWHADHGVWQMGNPTSGPGGAHEGTNVAATDLSGNYPDQTDSRLVSPAFELPALSGEEQIELRFWHWFDYDGGDGNDKGYVQLSVWNGSAWGDWTTLATPVDAHEGDYDERTYNSGWSRCAVELTTWAGQQVRLAFCHSASSQDSYDNSRSGWYIDEVEIWRGRSADARRSKASRMAGATGTPSTASGRWEIRRAGLEARTTGRTWPPRTFPAVIPTRPTVAWSALPLSCRPYRATSKSSFASGNGSTTTEATATIKDGLQVSVWDGTAWGEWATLATPVDAHEGGLRRTDVQQRVEPLRRRIDRVRRPGEGSSGVLPQRFEPGLV